MCACKTSGRRQTVKEILSRFAKVATDVCLSPDKQCQAERYNGEDGFKESKYEVCGCVSTCSSHMLFVLIRRWAASSVYPPNQTLEMDFQTASTTSIFSPNLLANIIRFLWFSFHPFLLMQDRQKERRTRHVLIWGKRINSQPEEPVLHGPQWQKRRTEKIPPD